MFKKVENFFNFLDTETKKFLFKLIQDSLKKRGVYFDEKNNFQEEEFTKYINKIFEQQEKEKIVRWLVNSIRESLDLDKVLTTIVVEIGKLLNVDRCIIALYEKENNTFYLRGEYRKNEKIEPLFTCPKKVFNIPETWQDILSKNFHSVVINNSQEEFLQEIEAEYLKNNGTCSEIIVPVFHNDEILGIIAVHQISCARSWEVAHIEILMDTGSQIAVAISQAGLYTKIQEATQLKSEFITSMSHELRTPLNAIIGFSDMLLTLDYGELNEKQTRFIKNIAVSGQHLLRLVNDILDLSRIESDNMELNIETFYVYPAISETVSVLKSVAMKKNVEIIVEVSSNILIKADLRRFKQIMYNLLSNSIKFTREGGYIIVRGFTEKQNLKVEVHDNGVGIALKDRDKIFSRFSQLNSSVATKQEGTGLGLTLTKKLIELHKGKIDFNSVEGKGSIFWFILPGIKQDELMQFDKT